MTLWSHHVTSRITCGRSHMRTTEIELNKGTVMAPKKTDNSQKSTTDARAKRF